MYDPVYGFRYGGLGRRHGREAGARIAAGVQALALAMLGFALWFLSQSLYVIGSLCVFCLICFVGLLLANWGWLRLNSNDLPLGDKGRVVLQSAIKSGADTFGWAVLALVLFLAIILRFG